MHPTTRRRACGPTRRRSAPSYLRTTKPRVCLSCCRCLRARSANSLRAGRSSSSMIATMLDAWRRGADMVCAAKASRAEEGWLKRLGTWAFYALVNRDTRSPIPADASDFRLMDRKVVEALKALPERNRFMKGLYAWVGFRTEVLPYAPAERRSGKTRFSGRRLRALAYTGITAFTNAPLRLWSGIGAAAALIALAYGSYVIRSEERRVG